MAKQVHLELMVMVDTAHLDKLDEVTAKLKQAGLQKCNVLKEIGAVTGSATAEAVSKIEKVAGVSAVERSRGIQLAPPDSEIQ